MSVLEKSKPIEEMVLELYEPMEMESNLDEQDLNDLDIDYLDSTNTLQARLEAFGYHVPILKVRREMTFPVGNSKKFDLFNPSHDIYENKSFNEFQNIITRLRPGEQVEFKLQMNYKNIWRGLTGK